MSTSSATMLENTLVNLRRSIELGRFPDTLYKVLSKPERAVIASIPVRMDDGRIEVFEAYRVQHCSVLGPYKGGVRFHPNVTLEDDIALATIMTLKNSLANLPYGGGKGAVRVDQRSLSRRELEELSRGYVRAFYPVLGELLDIPGPDAGTDPQVMAWMVDECCKMSCRPSPASFTGKPVELGGDPVRLYATGFGCAVVTKLAAEEFLGSSKNSTLAIQGFGNVGSWHAYWASKMGFKVIAISDIGGTIFDPNGIDVEKALQIARESGTVRNYPAEQYFSDTKMALFVEADVVAADALENQITRENAQKVKAKLVIEGANAPVTPEAEKILTERGVTVIPDILANAGGVITSYFEWAQNIQRWSWGEEETRSRLTRFMEYNFNRVKERWKTLKLERGNVTLRDAALVTALERIYAAMKLRGWL
ncbi:MAG: Glu/Leu/Phe/Val dehydrogenase [Thermofilaceae archaeon]|nr:Glu/Leu/Phe/Val dehydrogenase [Thermofilaceae archaeon]MDW8004372.1 Glu/Leu/Phe/Val dehydrogenase [Thermofilaceae archaeon]